ncbi:hypothetical protein BH09MYX1_BH09MYX1_64190 [soil metagenome]
MACSALAPSASPDVARTSSWDAANEVNPEAPRYVATGALSMREWPMSITLSGLIFLLIIAAICGAIGRAIAGQVRGGLIVSIVLGFVGALLGSWIARQLGLPEPLVLRVAGESFPVVWSIVGAALFVALIHLISRRWR